MKAVILADQLGMIQDHPLPKLDVTEALIRPTLVGICNTDLELVKGYMGFRGILGHEFVGVVEECSDPTWLGKRVVGEINCSPRDNIIDDPRHQAGRTVLGILGRDGVMAQRFALPIENLLEVPEGLSDEKAVFTEPLAAAYQITSQMGFTPKSALVLGDGKLGALCALALRDQGSDVTWLGKHKNKLGALEHLVTTKVLGEQLDTYPLVVLSLIHI